MNVDFDKVRQESKVMSAKLNNFSDELYRVKALFKAEFDLSDLDRLEGNYGQNIELVDEEHYVSDIISENNIQANVINSSVNLKESKINEGPIVSKENLDVKEDIDRSNFNLKEYINEVESCSRCDDNLTSERNLVNHFFHGKILSSIDVLFVGDHPKELTGDGTNRSCFTDDQGLLMDRMISAMKLGTAEYAKTLAVKCYNSLRSNFTCMFENCNNHIYEEIILLKPKVVITLGALSTNSILGKKERLTNIHGKFIEQEVEYKDQVLKFVLCPIFHPEFLLINPSMKRTTWIDLQNVMKYIGKSI